MLHSPFFSSLCELLQLFWDSMCHTAANELQCHEEKARGKMMVSWKGISGKTSWIGLLSGGDFHGITGPSRTLCQNQIPFRSHSSSQHWLSLGCTDLSQRSYKDHINKFQRIHSKSTIQTAQLNFKISYQNLFPLYTALSPATKCGTCCLLNGALFFPSRKRN